MVDARLTRFSGVVLTGGRSTRMGQDKAFLRLADRSEPLVMTSARALRDAGAAGVVCVGGARAKLTALGLDVVPDDHPDEGPLGGLLTGLRVARLPIVVVLTCDMPSIDAVSVRTMVQALIERPDADGPWMVRFFPEGISRGVILWGLADAFAAADGSRPAAVSGVDS